MATVKLEGGKLTRRWYDLRYHAEQVRYYNSTARFTANHSGRRSGKTEIRGKRRGVKRGLELGQMGLDDGRVVFSAPTHAQAKEIFWSDLKKLVPPWLRFGRPRESDLTITLVTGVRLQVIGMDKPERIEGSPLDHIVLDEYGNMKKETWDEHIRPALFTVGRPPGTADFVGVPDPRGIHWKDLCDRIKSGDFKDAELFFWFSSEILPSEEIDAVKSEMDEQTFQQEYEGSFVTFSGRAYYSFTDKNVMPVAYIPDADLVFCFDFNVEPGVAAIVQEQIIDGHQVTCIIGEVWIPKNSNTPAVCKKLLEDWGHHKGKVWCYGDATGGARGTAQTEGSDWELIKKILTRHWGDSLYFEVPRGNPAERARINAVNSRCASMAGDIRLYVDPVEARHVIRDFESAVLLEGGAELDKKSSKDVTHITDALGYYVWREYPVQGERIITLQEI